MSVKTNTREQSINDSPSEVETSESEQATDWYGDYTTESESEQSWNDNPSDIDTDYIDVKSERATGCYTDDPEKEAVEFDRTTEGNSCQHRREMDANEYEFNTRFAPNAEVRTLWDGNHYNAFEEAGRKYRLQMDLFVKGAVADSFAGSTYERDTIQWLTTFISQTFPNKSSQDIERILWLIRNDPRIGNGWNVKRGYKGAVVGYAAHIADWDNPIEEIEERISIDALFDSTEEIEEAIRYAAVQIDERDIDVSNY